MRRLLILSCSARKRPDPGYLPAIERYDGPAFRVVRRFLQERPGSSENLDIFILSAAYGLIPARQPIALYDCLMSPHRAGELHKETIACFAHLMITEYTEICLAMSRTYLAALEGWAALIPGGVSVTVADGPQGVRLQQLKHWLWGGGNNDSSEGRREVIRRHGAARLRGVELRLTPDQVLEQARSALAEDGVKAHRFRDWYVDVNGQRIAPKWLVSKLTGLPVSAFTSGEARRVLCRLGIPVKHI